MTFTENVQRREVKYQGCSRKLSKQFVMLKAIIGVLTINLTSFSRQSTVNGACRRCENRQTDRNTHARAQNAIKYRPRSQRTTEDRRALAQYPPQIVDTTVNGRQNESELLVFLKKTELTSVLL